LILSDKLTGPSAWSYSRFHSRPGVFAAGDVRSGAVKRCAAAAAVGEGGMAMKGIHQTLGTYT